MSQLPAIAENTPTVCGFPRRLIYGVSLEEGGGTVHDFELLKAGGVTETIRTNTALRKQHPQQWLGRLACSVLEHVGGRPVYAEFKRGGFKDIPRVVKDLVAADASYVLALGHMHTFGSRLDLGRQECPRCGRRDDFLVDLTQMRLVQMDRLKEEYRVDLPTGWHQPPASDPSRRLPFQGKHWNTYFFRPPTVADSIACEPHLTGVNAINFFMRLVWSGLLRVEQWGDGAKLDEMEPQHIRMVGLDLVDELDSADRMVIRRTVTELPRLDTEVLHECGACGEEIPMSVGASDFFPLA